MLRSDALLALRTVQHSSRSDCVQVALRIAGSCTGVHPHREDVSYRVAAVRTCKAVVHTSRQEKMRVARVPPQSPYTSSRANLRASSIHIARLICTSCCLLTSNRYHTNSHEEVYLPRPSSLRNASCVCPKPAHARHNSQCTADEVPVDCSADEDGSQASSSMP